MAPSVSVAPLSAEDKKIELIKIEERQDVTKKTIRCNLYTR